ncbi:TIR domain-containing adapter molecule 1 [Bagarius yarrelli]|uniref:TIR domain-containing adapter molecule 1 n=1 Tax=Bagarius yarrelli TaxID=175774 RepID=A0A556TS83_BAGYA|nr:TIR domain-containing adapter molecule 1 [Bagarius yarrelli]
MAEEIELVNEPKLTKLCANSNTVVISPSERSNSELKGTAIISGEPKASACSTMGASLQLVKETAEVVEAQTEPPKRDDSYPSSLHSNSSSCSSYSLEISVSTTTTNNTDKESRPLALKTPPNSRTGQNQMTKTLSSYDNQKQVPSLTKSYESSDPKPVQEKEQVSELKLTQCQDTHGTSEVVTPKSPRVEPSLEKTFLSSPSGDGKVGAQPVSNIQPSKAPFTQQEGFKKENHASQETEDMFYAFVILHAQEDFNEAVRLKNRLESISSTIGATFAEDFEMPGYSTFKCIEDAIENSAYIMLLLTTNFNDHLNETNTDSALMNSIDKTHKYNTVIPLLPRTNGLSREQMRPVLKTKNPLDETKDREFFQRMVRKVLDSKNIQRQKLMWKKEQLKKKQKKQERSLLQERQYQRDLIQGAKRVQEIEKELQEMKMQQQHLPPPNVYPSYSYQGFNRRTQSSDHMPFPNPSQMPVYHSGNMWQPPPSNICIQNAKCIMIGNNSTMTVGGGVDSSEEENL